MSIIDTALIGKLKKTKADKSNVLEKNGDVAYTPVGLYHPTTKKYVDDTVYTNKLKSISDTPIIQVLDQKSNTTANDLSTYIGAASQLYAKNYPYSLFMQNQNMVFNESDLTLPLTIECWFYYLDDSASSTRIFEIGGTVPGDKTQFFEMDADGSVSYTNTTGVYAGMTGGSFTPYAGWVHYAMYVGQTDWCVWINGNRQSLGTFPVVGSEDYRQTVARTYVSLGSYFSAAPGYVQPYGLYDSVRVSSGDRYGKANASFTPPEIFTVDGTTKHLYHISATYDANVSANLYVNAPTQPYHAASKSYVDNAIASIPVTVDTNTYVINGDVQGNTLTLNQNNGTSIHIDVSSLLDDTTNTISSGTLSGNNITFTRQDGTTFNVNVAALYDDTNIVTSVNGSTGAITVPTLSSLSFNTSTKVLSASKSDGTTLTADLSSLAGQTFDQSLNTTNDVHFNVVSASLGDFPNLNVNNAISFSTVNGSPNQVIITKADGHSWWSDIKTINGASLIGTGNITTPDTHIVSGDVSLMFKTLRLTNNDSSIVSIDVSPLLQDWGQSLYTTSDVNFNSVVAPYGDFPHLNVNNGISFGTVSGSANQVIVTANDGKSVWSNIKTINGTSLIGTGDITITANGIDTYVTSGTVSGSTLTLTHNTGSTVSINVGALLDDTTNTVSSGTLIGNVIRFTRQNGTTFDVDVAALYDDTNIVTSVNGQTGAITVTDTNNYLVSATLDGNTLNLARSGLGNLTVDLSSLKTTDTDNYVDSATLNGNILTLGRSGSLPDLTVDLSSLSGTGGGTSTINVFSRRETQDFIAQAGQTIFATNLGLIDVEVFYNGIKLDSEDYTISGQTITLLEAAQAGDNIEVVDYGSQDLTGETFITSSIEPTNPALGTVWQDTSVTEPIVKIWNGSKWVIVGDLSTSYNKRIFEITTPTSTFNVQYTGGLVEVYLNGLKLANTEYNAIDGVTVGLTAPANIGDYVEIITLTPMTSGLFYTKLEVDALIGQGPDLTNYYTKTEVDQMIAGAGTGSAQTSGLTSQVIDTFSTNQYISGEYLITVTGNSGMMLLKLLVLFNGTAALNSQYGQLGTDLGVFDTLVNGSDVQIVFTPIDSSATVQFSRTLTKNLGGNTPSLPSDLNSGSGTVDLNSGSGTIDLNGTLVGGDLMSGSGIIDLLSGSGINDLNQ